MTFSGVKQQLQNTEPSHWSHRRSKKAVAAAPVAPALALRQNSTPTPPVLLERLEVPHHKKMSKSRFFEKNGAGEYGKNNGHVFDATHQPKNPWRNLEEMVKGNPVPRAKDWREQLYSQDCRDRILMDPGALVPGLTNPQDSIIGLL